MKNSYDIHVEGLVQGVGFRPFVYRIARQLHLTGYVDNRNDGAHILLQSSSEEKDEFLRTLFREKPQMAEIRHVRVDCRHSEATYSGFRIVSSRSVDDRITRISPDIAVCDQCLADMYRQSHRLGYPFINCTHCGPRFSITRALPYDRAVTTMEAFSMCGVCRQEYDNPSDRRFHAQPVACCSCGPHYRIPDDAFSGESDTEIIDRIARSVETGGIVALKGLGGYNLICRSDRTETIDRLRELKQRYRKPLAVMFRNADVLETYLELGRAEKELLTSWRRPIVLLREKKKMNEALNPGLNRLGALLPYLPVQVLLFDRLSIDALVLTSGNWGDEPIITDDEEAVRKLGPHVDLLVVHDREIYNRVDDSVVQITVGDRKQVIRRSRGYVPEPIETSCPTEGIWAFGAEMVNTFAIGKGRQILVSPYIGDLKNSENVAFYRKAMSHFRDLFRSRPQGLVCDLHPAYTSTRLAEEISREEQLPLYRIQHHFAHAATVLAEKNITDETVLAVCLDGTGYGDDGYSWGGEFLACSSVRYERLSHLPYVPLPGGDKAAREPWRMAIACLETYLPGEELLSPEWTERIGVDRVAVVRQMIRRQLNVPLSSSAGRLFDAFSSLLGLCDYNSFQAEAALRLEQVADPVCQEFYPFDTASPLDLSSLFRTVLIDRKNGIPVSRISARIHHSLGKRWAIEALHRMREAGLKKILFSGGVFQNKRLTECMVSYLKQEGVSVLMSETLPCNDGGISAGQLFIVANRIKSGYYA